MSHNSQQRSAYPTQPPPQQSSHQQVPGAFPPDNQSTAVRRIPNSSSHEEPTLPYHNAAGPSQPPSQSQNHSGYVPRQQENNHMAVSPKTTPPPPYHPALATVPPVTLSNSHAPPQGHHHRSRSLTHAQPGSSVVDPSAAAPRVIPPPRGSGKEIYTYNSPVPTYALDWSKRPDPPSFSRSTGGGQSSSGFRLAVGSFVEDVKNHVRVVMLSDAVDSYYGELGSGRRRVDDKGEGDFVCVAEVEHLYPASKVLWEPYKSGLSTPDLLATTSDYLRIWELLDDPHLTHSNNIGRAPIPSLRLTEKAVLHNVKAEFTAPLTSFDWNETDPSLIVTSSIDTTCTVWNIETRQAKTQLIAHDREVYDVAFAKSGADVFASVGADGSVRMFDLRSLEHSTIIYESPPAAAGSTPTGAAADVTGRPLLRLAFNPIDTSYIATFHMDSLEVQILDIRVPGLPVTELRSHSGAVNCVSWAPHMPSHLCSGGDDSQVLVWDLNQANPAPSSTAPPTSSSRHVQQPQHQRILQDPILAYTAEAEVNSVCWNTSNTDWVAIGVGRTVQALRV